MKLRALFMAALMAMAAPAFAETDNAEAAKETEARPVPEPVMFVTQHSGTFGRQKISYKVEAGETQIKNDDGKPAASLFTISCITAAKSGVCWSGPTSFLTSHGGGDHATDALVFPRDEMLPLVDVKVAALSAASP